LYFRFPDQLMRIRSDRSADLNVFSHIKAPLAKSIFRDKGLALPNALSDLGLHKAAMLAGFDKRIDKSIRLGLDKWTTVG
jgi:hypothetical protein